MSSISGKKLLYTQDGHRKYVSKDQIQFYLDNGCLQHNPNKKDTRIEKLMSRISYDDIYNYYEVQNHTVEECLEHFNIKDKVTFHEIRNRYGFYKSTAKHAQNTFNGKLKKYGSGTYNNATSRAKTCMLKYGVASTLARKDVREVIASKEVRDKAQKTYYNKTGKKVWNEGLRGVCFPTKESMAKRARTLRAHNTFNKSKPEDRLFEELQKKYGDVKRNYNEDPRYPWHCDFYIPSEDLFIELNDFPTHYKEPFDKSNSEHVQLLEQYTSSPKNWIEAQRVQIWAGTDVIKRETAIKNHLNYIIIYGDKWYNVLDKDFTMM